MLSIRVVAPKNGEIVLSRAKLFSMGEGKIVRRVELSDQSRMGGIFGANDWKGVKRRRDLSPGPSRILSRRDL